MKFSLHSCALVLMVLGLGACATNHPSASPDAPLPDAWRNAAGFPTADATKDLSRWWRHFGDPTLNRLIATGLAHSPDLASAAARIREAEARREGSVAALFPILSGSASANSGALKRDGSDTTNSESYSAGLNASWEADLFGKNRRELDAATANVGVAQENFHSAQAALAAAIATAYTDLRANETRLTVLQSTVKTREETAQLATWRLQAGDADTLEANQARSSLESARAGIPSLKQAVSQTRNRLALLCGQAPGALDGMLSGKAAIPNPPARLAIGIPADSLRQRPDVRQAGYSLAAAVANTQAAQADRFPSLRLSGSLGINSLSAGKLFTPETATANLIAGLTGPILDAGRIQSNIAAQGAAQDQAVEAYRRAVLTALSEVEDALIACRRSAERLDRLEAATRLSREADVIARQRYQAGEIDFLAVLDTQRALLGLEDNLLATRTDRTIAYIRLYQALGGGWAANP